MRRAGVIVCLGTGLLMAAGSYARAEAGEGHLVGPVVADETGVPEVSTIEDLEIPTRSGNVLRGDLYLPVIDGKPADGLPTVVTYFPYVKDDDARFEVDAMRRFARSGYAGLLVDIAGTGVSPGEFGFLSAREIADGYDVVEWAAGQSFSSGRVGLWGYSYPGLTAAHIAATRPPHLEAAVPASIFHDAYRDLMFPGGIVTTQDAVLLPIVLAYTVARQRADTDPALALEAALDSIFTPGGIATLLEAPTRTTYDSFWQERALENKIGHIEVPTLLWGGWSDVYPRGTLLNHTDLGADHVRLVMGPWGHLAGVGGEPFELLLEESLRWFDTFLRHEATPEAANAVAGGASIFDVDWDGTDVYAGVWPGRFVEFDQWPADTEERTLSLCAGRASPDLAAPWPIQGSLAPSCETAGQLPVVNVPIDVTGGGSIAHDAYADLLLNPVWDDKDQPLSLTSTALLSEPLEEDLLLTGPARLSLTASTLGLDADWVIRVVDVGPEQTRVVAPGWLRASRRHVDTDRPYLWHTHDRNDVLTPGEPYEMDIEIWPSSYRVPAGHRLGVLIRTADTLKNTAGISPSVTNTILTGPGTVSALTIHTRPTSYEPTPAPADTAEPTPDTTGPDGTSAHDGQAGSPDPRALPETGGRGIPLVAVALMVVVGVGWHRLHSTR